MNFQLHDSQDLNAKTNNNKMNPQIATAIFEKWFLIIHPITNGIKENQIEDAGLS